VFARNAPIRHRASAFKEHVAHPCVLLALLSLTKSGVSVEKSRFTTRFFVPAGLLVIRFFSFFRPGSCSCNLRGWLTAEESHQPFQVLHRGRQIELLAHEAHPAQPQSA
jgi:hypothetical protein